MSSSGFRYATTTRKSRLSRFASEIVCRSAPPIPSRLGMGGAERHTISLANLLSRDFRVVVAYLKPEEDMIGQLQRQSLLEVRCLHAQKRVDLRAARELAALAQAHGATMIVCANAFALMYAQLANWLSPNSLVVMEIFHT